MSGNGFVDYFGAESQQTSDVETVSADASVGDGGTQRNPLFVDLDTPDLRLQSLATGFPFDSPAIGIASDGGDAGAYDVYRGPVVTTWTVIDLSTPGWYNPDHVARRVQPVKITEGEQWGGGFYSEAQAYNVEHVLQWGTSNPMPAAELAALQALYTTGSGEAGLSLDDGATYLTCQVKRSEAFEHQELAGLGYTTDEVPRPLGQVVLRQVA
jgi:hypothetical protein